ncbi:MAG: hypothetical protein GKR98_06740 [Boseongicola sp.]|nr:MAG: hypothetical protein GKR98_06740 [Boseongicola sp.]
MSSKFALIAVMVFGVSAISGCVPVAVGAVGAVAVDSAAESRGTDLF